MRLKYLSDSPSLERKNYGAASIAELSLRLKGKDTGVFFWKEILNAQELKEYTQFEVVHPREWNLDEQI